MGKKLKIFSALEVANLCGVVNQTAINWIKNGYLNAFTTPGGQYRIYAENLIEFIESRGMIIPDELLLFKVSKDGRLRIQVIDSDPMFGELIRAKSLQFGINLDVVVSLDSFQAGYDFAKTSPGIIIIKKSFKGITPEKIKTVLRSEKSLIPFIIHVSDIEDDGEVSADRNFIDFFMDYPVDFKILFDYIKSSAGKVEVASR